MTADHIEAFRRYWQEAGADHHTLIGNLCDMAIASLAQPVPEEMAEDAKIVKMALTDLDEFEKAGQLMIRYAHPAIAALDRMIAYLLPTNKQKNIK